MDLGRRGGRRGGTHEQGLVELLWLLEDLDLVPSHWKPGLVDSELLRQALDGLRLGRGEDRRRVGLGCCWCARRLERAAAGVDEGRSGRRPSAGRAPYKTPGQSEGHPSTGRATWWSKEFKEKVGRQVEVEEESRDFGWISNTLCAFSLNPHLALFPPPFPFYPFPHPTTMIGEGQSASSFSPA